MSNDQLVADLADKARKASKTLITAGYSKRQGALLAIADALETNMGEILEANKLDMERGKANGLNSSLLDRLALNPERIKDIAAGARQVAALDDPLGIVLRQRTLSNGLKLTQVTVPFGVIGMVYEARPNVTVDAAVILLMSGNAALLRGSSSAQASNEVLVKVMRGALEAGEISSEVIQLIPSSDRDTTRALLHARGKVDLVIPRGSAELIRMVVDDSTVPTIETGAGVCHVYIDKSADFAKAIPIVINSKTHRPSVCNAAETLLVHKEIAKDFLPLALKELNQAGVILHCDQVSLEVANSLAIPASLATEENWSTEYGVLEMNVAVVSDLESAAAHILKYGTNHTEAIVTESNESAERFIALADCAAVMVNASTRFTDGQEMGFGAEIGISNQKLHARGPMGLEQMTTTTWIVRGDGQIRK
ncbi:MAG: glutamate-5-semialdehyde dehydrogenase [Actinobacteria bacterium]|nr:glutamate-5-semialdehyde dehydrogenase [Actinomycetota bacterium]NCU83628.1 glutamate-5-semialdehyde dehydrogenase [Actinomycetota bacterium]